MGRDPRPLGTLVAGGLPGVGPDDAIWLSDGAVVLVHRTRGLGAAGEPVYQRLARGGGLQRGPGEVHLAGIAPGADGALRFVVDGRLLPDAEDAGSLERIQAWA